MSTRTSRRGLAALALCLAAALALCLAPALAQPAHAATEGPYTYEVARGKAIITGFDDSVSGKLTIPSKLGGYPVVKIHDFAFQFCNEITSVTIPSTVTTIGEYAFCECFNIESVRIPNSVTSIGYCAFACCTSLKSVVIPSSVKQIRGLFCGCSSLESVTIPSSVTNISSAFTDCTSLKSVTIPSSVTNISSAFTGCTRLKSVTIPSSVTDVGWDTFADCTSLDSVYIPKSVVRIGDNAFKDCWSLEDVYYSGTERSWKKIKIGYGNDFLTTSRIHLAKVKLSAMAYTYNGKVRTPRVTVTYDGKKLVKNRDYTVSYSKGRKSVWAYKVTVKGKGAQKWTETLYFKVNPKGTWVKSLKRERKGFTVNWKKQSMKMSKARITGYQVRYSLKSSMKSAKVKTVRGYTKTSLKVSKLKAGKKYYVQVRTYKEINGKRYYSAWSAKKSVRTK